jgi:hypothetical protein
VTQLLIQIVHGNWIDPTFLLLLVALMLPESVTSRWEPAPPASMARQAFIPTVPVAPRRVRPAVPDRTLEPFE